MAKKTKKAPMCPECKGKSTRGMGYEHTATCSKRPMTAAKAGKKALAVSKVNVWELITSKTPLRDLIEIETRLHDVLKDRDKTEVKKVRDLIAKIQKDRAELDADEKALASLT